MKILKIVCAVFLVSFLIALTGNGCFSVMKKGLDGIDGGDTSVGMKEVLLDTATLPLQIVILGPLIVAECIKANTGERGERARAKLRWNIAKDEAHKTLERDFDSIFADERFFSSTNTPQREMLGEWLGWYNISQLTGGQAQRVLEKVIEKPCLLVPLAPICMRSNITSAQFEWCIDESLKLATNRPAVASEKRELAPLSWTLENSSVTDDELLRIAEMSIEGLDIDHYISVRTYQRRKDIANLLVTGLNDGNAWFLDRPGSIAYAALRPAINDCHRHGCIGCQSSFEYLFARMERNPALIDECLELYEFDKVLSPKRKRRNQEFALERAERDRDARVLLKVLCHGSTPQGYREAALANPKLDYCREEIAKALSCLNPKEKDGRLHEYQDLQ